MISVLIWGPRPHYPRVSSKWRFNFEDPSNVFHAHCTKGTKQCNDYRFFFEGGGAGKSHDFLSTRKWKAGVFKILRFEGCFRKAPFWWMIGVGGRPKYSFKFLRRSVEAARVFTLSMHIRIHRLWRYIKRKKKHYIIGSRSTRYNFLLIDCHVIISHFPASFSIKDSQAQH